MALLTRTGLIDNQQTIAGARQSARIHYFDAARSLAICAVMFIHAADVYLFQYGKISFWNWNIANFFDICARWGVPVFIIVSGALLIKPGSDFDAGYYIKRRLLKVVFPFLVWSVIYAIWRSNGSRFFPLGLNWGELQDLLVHLPSKPVTFHLYFFYYFIPLYFVIPFLSLILAQARPGHLLFYIYTWLFLSALIMMKVETGWHGDLCMFSGYLLAGYYMNQYDFLSRKNAAMLLAFSLLVTFWGTWLLSVHHGNLALAFDDYKILNVAVGAICVVQLVKYAFKEENKVFAFVSRHSFGIFLIHLLFLSFYQSQFPTLLQLGPMINIPLMAIFSFSLSLLAAWTIAKIPILKYIVP